MELLARIRAVTRRGQLLQEENILKVKDLTLNTKTYELIRGQSERIELTKKELQLLELFMRNKGQVITRTVIFDRIWGYDVEVNDNMLDALIKLLRKKIDHPGKETYIQTVRGVGYRIEES
ncbi:MAG TPA: response regulator transcription factor [Bacilli bacterium]|nr:response regulator transcription factor [Bacilli bacterium]